MTYPKSFKEKAQELYPEPEYAYLHDWISKNFTTPVGRVLDALAVGPIKNPNASQQLGFTRELDEKEKLYELWENLAYNK